MKHIAFLCAAIAMSGCAGQSEFLSRNTDLPGIPRTITCDATPVEIYSKSGDLIEVSHPVLHPSCYGEVQKALDTTSLLPTFMGDLKFGPPRYRITSILEADDDPFTQIAPADTSVIELAAGPAEPALETPSGEQTDETPPSDVSQEDPTSQNPDPVDEPTNPRGALSKLDQLKEHAGLL